jgi:hypothetical protein
MKRSASSSRALWIGAAAILAGVGAFFADIYGVSPVAQILDRIVAWLYGFFPDLSLLPEEGWYWVSGAVVSLTVFLIAVVCFSGPASETERLAFQLRKRAEQCRKAHRAGFNS